MNEKFFESLVKGLESLPQEDLESFSEELARSQVGEKVKVILNEKFSAENKESNFEIPEYTFE
jgi:hypothetical protein